MPDLKGLLIDESSADRLLHCKSKVKNLFLFIRLLGMEEEKLLFIIKYARICLFSFEASLEQAASLHPWEYLQIEN